jgi:drug/metabolite transporter (DMT)-like permease
MMGSKMLFAGIRFFISGLIVLAVAKATKRDFSTRSKNSWWYILLFSLMNTTLHYAFFYIGLSHSEGARAAILNSLSVFSLVLLACMFFKSDRLTTNKIVGCIIGFAGVVIVNLGGQFDMSFTLLGDGFLMISAFAYALSSVLIKIYGKDEDPVMLSGYQFAAGGMIMIAAGLLMGGRLNAVSMQGVGLLLYMAFISAGAYTLWSLLLKYNPVSRVTVFGFMNPVFGVILSSVLLSEGAGLSVMVIVSLVLVSAGIVIVNRAKNA